MREKEALKSLRIFILAEGRSQPRVKTPSGLDGLMFYD